LAKTLKINPRDNIAVVLGNVRTGETAAVIPSVFCANTVARRIAEHVTVAGGTARTRRAVLHHADMNGCRAVPRKAGPLI
jgi:altronate dehydratase